MTSEPLRIFLSYTAEDLREHARAVASALRRGGHQPVDHADWTATGLPSVRECRQRVAECQMLVVLVAHRYGWVPPISEGGDGERSITWLEVEEARRNEMPVLPLIVDRKAPWPVELIEGLESATARVCLERFKEQLQKGLCRWFTTPEIAALEALQAVNQARLRSSRTRRPDAAEAVQDAFTDYRRRLEHQLRRVKFLGFGEQFQVSLPISELWVPLTVSVPRAFEFEDAKGAPDRKQFHAEHVLDTSIDDAFREAQKYGLRAVVALGDPGSGKSTAARRLAWQCADFVQGPASLGLPDDLVPVLLRLRELPKEEFELGLEPMLRRQLAATELSDEPDLGQRLLDGRRVLWILDGLDEVASLAARTKVSDWIRLALARRTEDWFFVTSRYAGYDEGARLGQDFLVLHVRPLTTEQRREFVSRWYSTVERSIRGDGAEAHALATQRSAELLAILEAPDFSSLRLASMAANPLLISILCIVHRRDLDLPRRRADLYAKCVDVLLDSWRHDWRRLQGKGALDTSVARLVLQGVAWHLHQQESRTEAALDELAPVVQSAFDRISGARDGARDPGEFLRTIHEDSGLLVSTQPGRLAFLHLTFQEHLVARHCIDAANALELASHFGSPWWREPILLALSDARNEGFVAEFFNAVLGSERARSADPARPEGGEWLALLERSVTEVLIVPRQPFLTRLRESQTPGALKRVLVRLFMDSKDVELRSAAREVDERVRAAEVRAAVEAAARVTGVATARAILSGSLVVTRTDERTGAAFAEIPAGEFEMGGTRHGEEKPVHRVKIGTFQLAIHPVTNAQYERFLRQTGQPAPEYWTNARFNAPSQPVVVVSWEEARAYCGWAGSRLPSEAEWEYACRAGTRLEYWSGDEEKDLERVGWYAGNSGGKLHPVAEKSANAFGLHDMHGNVWEWCEDSWHPSYEGAPKDGSAWVDEASVLRVIRGGSFEDSAGYARSAYRLGRHPSNRWRAPGFRPARSITPG